MTVFTGDVINVAFGGQGIVRHEGLVVFIAFTAPGDHISYRIVERKKNFATGELVEVLKVGPNRIKPACPYFGRCGGCQLQHLDYKAQLEYKSEAVKEALKRIGQLDVSTILPVVPTTHQWAYRRHINLTLQSINDSYKAGYFAVDNQTLISLKECQIFIEKNNSLLQDLQSVISKLKNDGIKEEKGKITVLKLSSGRYLFQYHLSHIPHNFQAVMEDALVQHPHWQGVLASSPRQNITLGNPTAMLEVEGLKFSFSPRAFIQNHPEQSLNIYKAILSIAKGRMRSHILDLYCGIGISSVIMAREGISVTGIEFNSNAIEVAKKNALENGVKNVSFLCADVKRVLKGELKKSKPDLVIVNPPREGLEREVVQNLLKNPPEEIIYISCMPTTLARDLKLLAERYKIVSCQPYDMFPQTAHVETVVHLMNCI